MPDKMWVPNANPSDTRQKAAAKIKRGGIRAIDAGTRYDVSGRLRWLARKIDRGEFGDVRYAVVAFASKGVQETDTVSTYKFGTANEADALYLLDIARSHTRSR